MSLTSHKILSTLTAIGLVTISTGCVNSNANTKSVSAAEPETVQPDATTPASSTAASKDSASTQKNTGPLEDQPLILDAAQLIDDDGIGNINFQWQVLDDGRWVVADAGKTQSFTPKQEHVGKKLRVKVEYLDGKGTLESVTTPATERVQNVNDLPQGQVRLDGVAKEGDALQIDASSITDEDGLGKFSYQWQRSRDGVTWEDHRNTTADGMIIKLGQAEVGYQYRGMVKYTDGQGTQESIVTASTPVVRNIDDPTTGALEIVGTFSDGSTLQLSSNQITDNDGILSISTVWEISNDGQKWKVANTSSSETLTLNKSHVGMVVRAKAIVVDNFGTQSVLYSAVSSPIQNVNVKPRGMIRIMTVSE